MCTSENITVIAGVTAEEFRNSLYCKRKPVILRGLDIGDCIDKWQDVDYLARTGGKEPIKIHVSSTSQMNFISKNFVYKSLPFDEFVHQASEKLHKKYFISEEEKYYLRALGSDPRKDIADIHKQFPDLAKDIRFPELFPLDRFFSSVFRIASPGMQLWTHYDVMDNILIQVSGKKRIVLFDPDDSPYMYLNGDKSEVMDIDNPDLVKYPEFMKAKRYEGLLHPGDIIFIPALWFHNVISLDFGVAVNVFWKHLDDCMYDTRDTYGNKDHVPYARAQQILDRALKILSELPPDYQRFYGHRMISNIKKKVIDSNTESENQAKS